MLLIAGLVFTSSVPAQDQPEAAAEARPDSEIKRYKDWAVQCRQPETEAAKRCVMFQRRVLENGRTLLIMTVRRPGGDREPLAALRLPLGVLLEPGVSISVDGGQARNLTYRLCDDGGCIATFLLRDDLQTALKKGKTAKVVLVTADKKEISVDVSLSGFTAALNTL